MHWKKFLSIIFLNHVIYSGHHPESGEIQECSVNMNGSLFKIDCDVVDGEVQSITFVKVMDAE